MTAEDGQRNMGAMTRTRIVTAVFYSFALCLPAFCTVATVSTSYVAYRFESGENWQTRGDGDIGSTKLAGNRWSIDFSKGARWVAIVPPDRVLLGNVGKIRLRVRGAAQGHPVRIVLRTHFMTFYKVAGELPGAGEQEMVIDGPPGAGWQWMGGENDGRIHGPIRVGEIRLESNGLSDRCELELVSIKVEGSAPAPRRCVMSASAGGLAPVGQPGGGSPLRFENEVRCLSDAPLSGNLSWVFRDWEGREVDQGRRQLHIPAGAAPLLTQIPGPPVASALKFVEAAFNLEIPGQEVPEVSACWVPSEERRADPELRPESPFGMGLYLGRYRAGDDMDRAARAASEAGVKWSREGFSWAGIERQRGRFDWTFSDSLVACARRNGISIYGLVSGWAPWTRPYTDEGIADYVTFIKELVAHYKSDIHHWEIWNEPNIFFWQGPRDMYATLLARSYAAVKEVDPAAKVLGFSTAGIDYNFIARMLAKQVPFDVITIHPYRPVLDDQVFIRELKIVSDLVKVPDGPRRPVWITEMGWSTFTPHNTLRQDFVPTTLRSQAELIARVYLGALVSGVEPNTSWYDFRTMVKTRSISNIRWGSCTAISRPSPPMPLMQR